MRRLCDHGEEMQVAFEFMACKYLCKCLVCEMGILGLEYNASTICSRCIGSYVLS